MADELQMGIEHEREEHKDLYDRCMAGDCPPEDEFYGMIAQAHLNEDPEYYTHLEEIETGVGGEGTEESENAQEQTTEQGQESEQPMTAMRNPNAPKSGRTQAMQRMLRPAAV
jgi:hypothetical protein